MEVRQAQNLTVLIPVKKQKGQRYLEPQDQWLSTAVSRVRQPIEACVLGLKKKLASNAPVKCALITVSWYTSLVTRGGSVLLELFAGLALNSHFSSLRKILKCIYSDDTLLFRV